MPGVSPNIITHKLSIYKEARSVAQDKRKLGEEKRLVAKEEAEKLLSVGFIREVRYTTWLTNLVIVTKDNDKWRMCVDYTNLNKADFIENNPDSSPPNTYKSFISLTPIIPSPPYSIWP